MKKILKLIGIFLVVFVIFLYFVGSCTERPETNKQESEVLNEVTPDEYEKRLNERLKKKPKASFILQANASSQEDLLNDFEKKTPFYYIDDFIDNWFVGYNDIKDYFKGNESYPVEPVEPKESITIPYEYEFYGKNRVVYQNGVYEIITCKIMTSAPVKNKSKTGVVRYTRTNSYGDFTSFSFEISAYRLDRTFSEKNGFILHFYGLNSYTSGLTAEFVKNYLTGLHRAYFVGSSENSLKQFNVSSDFTVPIQNICFNGFNDNVPNVFNISSTTSNDYQFSQSVNNYYTEFKYWTLPNVYYNNKAGDIITYENVENYNQYGYTYNNVTNSIEFDPNLYSNFFDLDIKPKLENEFNNIFSHFPDIDATYSDDDTNVNYNNLVEIIKQLQQPSPVVTGNVNVDVDVTFPSEFYKTYPPLNTEPVFVAENPDVDFAFDSPLPMRVLETSGGFISLASDFLEDIGLMPVLLLCLSLGLIVMFFL